MTTATKAQNVVESVTAGARQRLVSMLCPVDQKPCEVIELIRERLLKQLESADADGLQARFDKAMAVTKSALPCDRCRQGEDRASKLTGLRLGKHERRILLEAPPPEAEQGLCMAAEKNTRAAAESLNRAIRRLCAAGLLRVGRKRFETKAKDKRLAWCGGIRRASVHKPVVRLSPLGSAVVDLYGSELRRGQRIRWQKRRQGLIPAFRRPASELLSDFRASVEKERGFLQWLSVPVAWRGSEQARKAHAEKIQRVSDVLAALQDSPP